MNISCTRLRGGKPRYRRFQSTLWPAPVLLLAALLFAAAGLSGRAATVTTEVEPNDFAAVATPIDLSSGSGIGAGTLATAADQDYYSFSAPPGAKLWIQVDCGDITVPGADLADPFLTVFAGDGETILEQDDDDGISNGCGSTLTNYFAPAIAGLPLANGGTYFIRLETFDQPIQAYRLFVALTVDAPTAEVEPNNTVPQATRLLASTAISGLAAGTLPSSADQDLYAVEMLAGSTLFLILDCDPERAGSIYLALDLVATNGSSVLYSSLLPFPRGPDVEIARAFCYSVPDTGTYYVRVRHGLAGFDPAAYHLMALRRGPGTLLFGSRTFIVEENTGTATLEVLRAGGSSGAVTVQFATQDGTATAPADYTALAQLLTFPDGISTQQVSISIVNDAVAEPDETVGLLLASPTGGAAVNLDSTAMLVILDNDELDDNTPAHATPVDLAAGFARLGHTAGGLPLTIGSNGDQDWFAVTAPPGATLWAFVDTGGSQSPGANSRDSQLALFAADGITLIEADDDDGTGNGEDGTIEPEGELASAIGGRILAEGGTYYLRVTAFEPSQIIAPYRLYVALTPAAGFESEANNLPLTADTLLPADANRGALRGSINVPEDADYFAITVPADTVVFISADCDPERDGLSTDLVLDLFTTNSPVPLLHVDSATAEPDSAEAFAYRFDEAGTYFLRVTHFSPAGTGTYTVMASRFGSAPLRIEQLTLSGADVLLHFTGHNGRTYEIQRTGSLTPPIAWMPLGTIAGTGAAAAYRDPGAAAAAPHFYRLREVP